MDSFRDVLLDRRKASYGIDRESAEFKLYGYSSKFLSDKGGCTGQRRRFMLGFVLALIAPRYLLGTLFLSALFTFLATTLGLSHGHSFTKTVLGNRLQLVAGIIMVIIAVKFIIVANG